MKNKLSLFLVFLISVPISSNAASFSSAKKSLYSKVYKNSGKTFYTECDFKNKKVDLSSCNLQNSFPKKQMKRAKRIEAEHVIPASWGLKKNKKDRSCAIKAKRLKTSARKYCQKYDPEYKKLHNDLINLRPAVGQINAERSNKPFSDKASGKNKKTFSGNLMAISSSRTFVPHPKIRGDIARIAFYMNYAYDVTYSERQIKLFLEWNQSDPISREERALNNKIKKIQGWGNPYIN